MIIDTVDNVVKAKHLVCDPFPIKFCRTTKYGPAISNHRATIHYILFKEVISIIKKTNAYIAKVYAGATLASNIKGSHFRAACARGVCEQL
jgi:hypothetical protein